MNLEERIILWLVQHEAASEERDLLNDALEELEQAREQLKAVTDGVNRRCGCGPDELPLVSLDALTARLAEANKENERLRPLVQCCERDHNLDGDCHIHPQGLRGEIDRLQSESRTLRERLVEAEARIAELVKQLHPTHLDVEHFYEDEAAKGGRDGT